MCQSLKQSCCILFMQCYAFKNNLLRNLSPISVFLFVHSALIVDTWIAVLQEGTKSEIQPMWAKQNLNCLTSLNSRCYSQWLAAVPTQEANVGVGLYVCFMLCTQFAWHFINFWQSVYVHLPSMPVFKPLEANPQLEIFRLIGLIRLIRLSYLNTLEQVVHLFIVYQHDLLYLSCSSVNITWVKWLHVQWTICNYMATNSY